MREIHSLAVVGARVTDGTGQVPLDDATVLIEGDRLVAIGPAATTPVPGDVERIDGRGKFVIPGLVDMHVHVYTPEKWHPELFLAAGVTTVLDLGGQLHDVRGYRSLVDSGARPGPRILFTGPMLEKARCTRASPGSAGASMRSAPRPKWTPWLTRAWTA